MSTHDVTPDESVSPVYLDPTPDEPFDPLPTTDVDVLRRRAYQVRSDPLFFIWQRGEGEQQPWLDEVAAIRAEYPKPGGEA